MTEMIEIHWTCGSIDEARRICRHLVEESLVACAQITPWIESIYMWDNQLETVQESKVVLKTVFSNYEKVREIIEKKSSYEIPEITFIKIDGSNASYDDWVKAGSTKTS